MNTYQVHVDTGSTSTVTPGGQATVTKTGANPFQCTVILGNRHRAIRSLTLKNAQIPYGFYNVRAPYNTMNISSTTYTITPGNYTLSNLVSAMNTTITGGVGVFSAPYANNVVLYTSAGTDTFNVQPQTLLSFLGFSNGQSGASIQATYNYLVNFDTYLNIWIENLGTSSLEPRQITFKVPVGAAYGDTIQWVENAQNEQCVVVSDRGVRLDRLNIQVLDRFGNLLNNNGLDWSFTIEIEADT